MEPWQQQRCLPHLHTHSTQAAAQANVKVRAVHLPGLPCIPLSAAPRKRSSGMPYNDSCME